MEGKREELIHIAEFNGSSLYCEEIACEVINSVSQDLARDILLMMPRYEFCAECLRLWIES